MSAYRLSPAADHQLDGIYDHSASTWGEEQADRYLGGLFDYFSKITSRRIVWRPIPAEFEVDGYFGKYEHHFVYWKEFEDGSVGIAAILHERLHRIERLQDLSPI